MKIVSFATLVSVGAFLVQTAVAAPAVTVTAEPNPPAVGKQYFTLEIKDDAGKAWAGKAPVVEVMMPAMPGMGEMRSKGKVEDLKGGKYKARVNISMEGVWYLTVELDGKEPADVVYKISTGSKQMTKVPSVPAADPLGGTGGQGTGHHHH